MKLRIVFSTIAIAILPHLLFSSEISITALIKIAESVDVPASESGVLKSVLVSEGDVVAEGELLAHIDAQQSDFQILTVQQECEIANAEASKDIGIQLANRANELAIKELDRAHNVNLGLPNSISERELNILRLTVEKTKLEILQATHNQHIAKMNFHLKQTQLKIAESNRERFDVHAPLRGLVVHVGKKTGEWVSPGELIARIVRVDRVRAEGFVSASDAQLGLQGQAATMIVSVPNDNTRRATGKVVFVSPEANPVDGRVRIWAELKNDDRLMLPGSNGRLSINVPDRHAEKSNSQSLVR